MKRHLQRLLPKNRFARNVSKLAGGTAAGQGIVVLASPLLTRLYTPEDFGILAVFASMLAILAVISSLCYQLAIPLPESEEDAASVVGLSLFVVLIVSFCVGLLVLAFGHLVAVRLNTPELASYLWLLPLGLLLTGVYQILYFWAMRSKAFTAISQTKLTQSAGMTTFQLLAFPLGPVGLLIGKVIGQAAGSTTLWRKAVRSEAISRDAFRPEAIGRAARRYMSFPVYSSGAGLLNSSGAQVPPLFFSAFFGPAAAGAYMLATRVLNAPLTVVGKAVADAFLPNAVEASRNGSLGEEVQKLFHYLAVLIFPFAAILFVIAPELFVLAFGAEWRQAGEMVRWLSPMLAIQFLINPLSRVFVALERQRMGLFLQGQLFTLRAASLLIAYYLAFTTLDAVKIFSGLSMIGYSVYYFAIVHISGTNHLAILRSLLPIFFVAVAFVFGLYAIYFYFGNGAFGMACLSVAALTGLAFYWLLQFGMIRGFKSQWV